jgi:hypothetical protein
MERKSQSAKRRKEIRKEEWRTKRKVSRSIRTGLWEARTGSKEKKIYSG